jgi:hypothetical protein
MARIQCNHVEGWELINGKLTLTSAEKLGQTDLSQAPDRSIVLGETKHVICLCPTCAAALKAEVEKW